MKAAAWAGAVAMACLVPALGQPAGHAHVHGKARMDVAIDSASITLALDSPLESLLGFERAPRSSAERERVQALVSALRAGTAFRIDPAAGCRLRAVTLDSPPLGLGPAAPGAGASASSDEHADLDGSFEFDCTAAARAGFIELPLFGLSSHLHEVDVQVATPRGQFARTLTPAAARLVLHAGEGR
ncbi:MAG TPA: DUF2796 domain-containing protein [Burkholderiaceae bacterium]|jgi:hypothetical protein|nr:DUF2796 domain-containing protein [Burkholderiaceae bacterium]